MPRLRKPIHPDADALHSHMGALNLPFMLEHHQVYAQSAADKSWSHLQYLTELINGEAAAQADRRVQRCINLARFPVLKTLDQFDWNWPTKINRLLIQNLFHLDFVKQRGNVVFISGTGLGKSHLMTALGHAACQSGHSVLFTGAVEIINTLAAAQASGGLAPLHQTHRPLRGRIGLSPHRQIRRRLPVPDHQPPL
jgi:DNA replication protein DnaC